MCIRDRIRAWLDILGVLLILLPFCLLIIFSSLPFVIQSYIHNEISPDPGGLTTRWLIKAVIPLSFFLLLIQGVADVLKNLFLVLGNNK